MFADILILHPESNYDQILTYALGAFRAQAQAGVMVRAPVRQSLEKGLILKIVQDQPDLKNIRPISGLIDSAPLLTEKALALAEWMSGYYACSLNKAVQMFFPPPVRLKEEAVLFYNPEYLLGNRLFSEKEEQILDYIKNQPSQPVPWKKVIRHFGKAIKPALAWLVSQGYLRREERFSSVVKEKKQARYMLQEGAPDWQEVSRKAPRQGAILRYLNGKAATSAELKKENLYAPAALKALQEKKWVAVSQEDVLRSPYTKRLAIQRPGSLNPEQRRALAAIVNSVRKRENKKWLLFGVTGSGKTEVYLQAIQATLRQNRQALYLVPEIALTPQVIGLLYHLFGKGVALLHSALTPGERYDEWMRIRRGEARVVLGPRSALFAPFRELGVIIIDEEHENTYKQSEPDPRYDARRVAEKMGELYQAPVVAGSATPSLQTYSLALRGGYNLLSLPRRVAARPQPAVSVIDMRKEIRDGNKSIFSRTMQEALEKTLRAGDQAILFLNRRGYHTFVMCRECGTSLVCPQCSIALTYHQDRGTLVCHYCRYHRTVPQNCPACGSRFIRYFGTGTERVAQELERRFPGIPYLRMDADTTTRKGSHTSILKEFQDQKAKVLIGTQMIAKGLDFPRVTLVGIISADTLLNMPDYQAGERSFQLLTQVAGRAGRGEHPGQVLIQTYNPEHYLFPAIIGHSYHDFFMKEIANREALEYPPETFLARVVVSGAGEKNVRERVDYLAELLTIEIDKNLRDIVILGPSPAPFAYLKGRFRHHLILKSRRLDHLQTLARFLREELKALPPEPRVIIDIEPQNLI